MNLHDLLIEALEHNDALIKTLHQLQQNKQPLEPLLRLPEVMELIPISKDTWKKGSKNGTYPKPIKIGKRAVAWKAEDIRAFCNGMWSNS